MCGDAGFYLIPSLAIQSDGVWIKLCIVEVAKRFLQSPAVPVGILFLLEIEQFLVEA